MNHRLQQQLEEKPYLKLPMHHAGDGRVAVRWIDFANPIARDKEGGDNGVEEGIRRLRSVIMGLVEGHGG